MQEKSGLPKTWWLVLVTGWLGLFLSHLSSPGAEWLVLLVQGVLLEGTAPPICALGSWEGPSHERRVKLQSQETNLGFFSSGFALWLAAVLSPDCGGTMVAGSLLLSALVRWVFHNRSCGARQVVVDFTPPVLALLTALGARTYGLSEGAAAGVAIAVFLWLVAKVPPKLFKARTVEERESWTQLRGWVGLHAFAVAFMAPVLMVLCHINPYYSILCLPVLGGIQRAARAEMARAQLLDQERLQHKALKDQVELERVAVKLQVAERNLHLKQASEGVFLQLGRQLAASESVEHTVEVALECLQKWVNVGTAALLLSNGTTLVNATGRNSLRITSWVERAWRENQPVALEGVSSPQDWVVAQEVWAVALPLEGRGVLYAGRAAPAFTDEERHILVALAGTLSLGLLSTQRYQEKLAVQGQILHSSKLAAVGQLAAGVAHELNTPLGAALLQLEMVNELVGSSQALLTKKVGIAERALTHCQGIIARLLYYSREGSQGQSSCDINEIVTDTLELFGKPLGDEGVDFVTHLGPLPRVVVNAGEIQQVLTNLLLNARDACLDPRARGHQIEIFTGADAQGVYLRLQDQGPGVDPQAQSRIFEPFFTTKPLGSGVGLGLSVSLQIAEKHGGKLWAANSPQGGACFTLALPLTQGQVGAGDGFN